MQKSVRFAVVVGSFLLSVISCAWSQTLEADLKRSSAGDLAAQARLEGDATRGAIVFFQPAMACAKCHAIDESRSRGLGPVLTGSKQPLSDEAIVDAILEPSKSIRQGFETASVITIDGKNVTGLLVSRDEKQTVLRVADGQTHTVLASDVEQFALQPQSLMPAGQMNQLTSRQQVLDLIRYLIEIRDGGAARARELQPSEALLTLKLPEYETHIDHAGLIQDWNADSLARGEAIYRRVCANCHGTKDQVGSLPTALRFAEGKFKNGSDALSMYGTLTRGFGFMPAQSWMVPSQKYDVIHYIRESLIKPSNASQFKPIDAGYLAGLPKGDTRGPEPSLIEPWSAMDYGPSLIHTYETPADRSSGGRLNIAYKGIAVRLDSGAGGVARGGQWMIFDSDTLRMASAWSADPNSQQPRFINWRDIQFNGEHGIHPTIEGQVALANSNAPGWADPRTGSFADDQRVEGRDQRRYGPLPRDWGKFRGLYHFGSRVILSYSIGQTEVLEMPGQAADADGVQGTSGFLRTLNIGPRDRELVLQVAEAYDPAKLAAGIATSGTGANAEALSLFTEAGNLRLRIEAGAEPLKFTLWMRGISGERALGGGLPERPEGMSTDASMDLREFTRGGPARWPQIIETQLVAGTGDGPFASDVLTAPQTNPWLAQCRFTGLDFFHDGSLAACTWDGDVWRVQLEEESGTLRWQRIASGLYQPLGLKIVREKIHVTCRDQLAVLHDLNGDGETDFYQCLNNDHQVTEHFHEFAMGLQVDAEGNFYYAKSGRHAKKALVPHHGTLLKVSPDGSKTEILATGFRAANGVCLNPDGSFLVTDQEGFWNPKNRINWVTLNPSGEPKFYGNLWGYTDVTDSSDDAMEKPLCWITNAFDRSPAELLWVDSPRWGALNGGLLNLSYGYGKVFLVLHEQVGDLRQGGMIELPIPLFPTGVMRGRFRPQDQQLYLAGMFAWAGNATDPGGLYRLRATGQPLRLPIALQTTASGLRLEFDERLDPASVNAAHAAIQTWSLKRTENYGSEHYDQKTLTVLSAELAADGKSVALKVQGIQPTWGMAIDFDFRSADGRPVRGVIHNTIHRLR
jgi:putative heme-binding domain-containing protein